MLVEFNRDNYIYFIEEIGLKSPLLFLGLNDEYDYELKFKNDFGVFMLNWQTAGIGCHHHYLRGFILKPVDEFFEFMKKLEKHWLDTNVGCFGIHLDELIEYRSMLNKEGLDCNYSYTSFEEGIYPIDCSVEIVRKISTTEVPDDFDEFLEFDGLQRYLGILRRWKLFILGENCD